MSASAVVAGHRSGEGLGAVRADAADADGALYQE